MTPPLTEHERSRVNEFLIEMVAEVKSDMLQELTPNMTHAEVEDLVRRDAHTALALMRLSSHISVKLTETDLENED